MIVSGIQISKLRKEFFEANPYDFDRSSLKEIYKASDCSDLDDVEIAALQCKRLIAYRFKNDLSCKAVYKRLISLHKAWSKIKFKGVRTKRLEMDLRFAQRELKSQALSDQSHKDSIEQKIIELEYEIDRRTK